MTVAWETAQGALWIAVGTSSCYATRSGGREDQMDALTPEGLPRGGEAEGIIVRRSLPVPGKRPSHVWYLRAELEQAGVSLMLRPHLKQSAPKDHTPRSR